MRGKRHSPEQRAALAALVTHIGYEIVADACNVMVHTVDEWVRVKDYQRSGWVPVEGPALAVLCDYSRELQEAGSPVATEFHEGVLSARAAADFEAVTIALRDSYYLQPDSIEEWGSPVGKTLSERIGPYDKFLEAPHMQADRIDFVRLGVLYRFACDLSEEVNVLPFEPDELVLMENAKPAAETLANSDSVPRSHDEALELQCQANQVIEALMPVTSMHTPYC